MFNFAFLPSTNRKLKKLKGKIGQILDKISQLKKYNKYSIEHHAIAILVNKNTSLQAHLSG